MSRDNSLMIISIDDVVHTLRECQRDWKYNGRFQPMLAFASELTGISEDGLMELMDDERGLDGNLGKEPEPFEMRVVDVMSHVYGLVYGVEVAPGKYVDVVQDRKDGTVEFLCKRDGSQAFSRVFSKVYDDEGMFVAGGVEFDMEAALKVVKETSKEYMRIDTRLENAFERADKQVGGCEGLSMDEIRKD